MGRQRARHGDSRRRDSPWTLSLRVPAGASRLRCERPAASARRSRPSRHVAAMTRTWEPGDTVVLDLDMPVRATVPDPRIDAVRGCVAFERGPLVYCLETADLPGRRAAGGGRGGPGCAAGAGAAPRHRRLGDRAHRTRHSSAPWRSGRDLRVPTVGGDGGRGRCGPLLHVGEPIGRGDARLDPGPTSLDEAADGGAPD